MQNLKSIIISRTDNIGDVILTLPLCGILKRKYPKVKLIFLGRKYTKPVVECCEHVNEFIAWDEIQDMDKEEQVNFFKRFQSDAIIHVFPNKQIAILAQKANLPVRIGTSHRLFHWLTCNRLINFSRRNSELHEAQLNLKLLSPFGISEVLPLSELQNYFGFSRTKPIPKRLLSLIDGNRFNLVLHPKSKGSAREWGIDNFVKLIKILPTNRFKIFITGTKEENESLKDLFSNDLDITDLVGKLSLEELISFIRHCDGLVAASTGPLHIAAVLGKKAIGIFSPIKPMHPARWAPIGKNAFYIVKNISCSDCRNKSICKCIQEISPEQIKHLLLA